MFAKKYKKGMADAAKAYEAFGKKQEDALKHILEEVREGKRNLEDALKDLDGNINNLYDYLQSKEKANLYTVYTPFDIAELDKMEKLFLAGALLSLAWDKTPTEAQKKFNSSILRYLDIKDPPSGINVLAIEHIDSTSAQKAIYQVILEYLILQNTDSYDETELQQNFLDAFNLNTKARESIAKYVELLYLATGSEGLAEKYGFTVEEESKDESTDNNKTDSSEEKKRLEKESALLVLKEMEAHNNRILILKDYIWWRDGGEDYVINAKSSSKEKIDWLTSFWVGEFISFKNLCCIVDYDCDKTYYLDFDAKKFRSLNINKRTHLLAMNEQWLIAKANNDILIYNLCSDTINTLNEYGESAYIFGDIVYIINHSKVLRYNLTTQKHEEILDVFKIDELKNRYDYVGDHGSICDSLIYQNKLYLLGEAGEYDSWRRTKKTYIYAVPLDNPSQYEIVADNIYAYSSYGRTDLFKFDSGWLFVSEDDDTLFGPKFNVTVFSCETNDISKLAKGCGEQREIKVGLFKNKTDYYRETKEFFKWNNYVFFKQATGSYRSTIAACVNVNEPMNITVAE